MISRRNVLLRGYAIGAGIIAAGVPGVVALTQGAPKLRRSLHGMAPNDTILQTWRDGVRLLKAASGNCQIASKSDPISLARATPSEGAKTGVAEPHIAEQSRSWRGASGERGVKRGS